ncbi:hypothetical protein [Haliscomenobacter sp.]|uniref:hypothetical protein n=1 Tax=Haliscomenobacter sp. TaxID=2717303 RepID=UPI003BACE6A2
MSVLRLLIIIILFGTLSWGCQTSTSQPSKNNPPAELQLAQATLDSCAIFIPLWQQKMDSLSKINEFEALKIQNNLNILEENLQDLQKLTALDLKSFPKTEELNNHLLQLSTQTQYVQALLASGKAIYEEHSQSFGKWKKE